MKEITDMAQVVATESPRLMVSRGPQFWELDLVIEVKVFGAGPYETHVLMGMAERLDEIVNQAYRLIDAHGIVMGDWTIQPAGLMCRIIGWQDGAGPDFVRNEDVIEDVAPEMPVGPPPPIEMMGAMGTDEASPPLFDPAEFVKKVQLHERP